MNEAARWSSVRDAWRSGTPVTILLKSDSTSAFNVIRARSITDLNASSESLEMGAKFIEGASPGALASSEFCGVLAAAELVRAIGGAHADRPTGTWPQPRPVVGQAIVARIHDSNVAVFQPMQDPPVITTERNGNFIYRSAQ